jgi:hypothetical protein
MAQYDEQRRHPKDDPIGDRMYEVSGYIALRPAGISFENA